MWGDQITFLNRTTSLCPMLKFVANILFFMHGKLLNITNKRRTRIKIPSHDG